MASVWRRAWRVAQSNISDLKDKATSWGRERPLDELSDAELEVELRRRRRRQAARAAEAEGGPEIPRPAAPRREPEARASVDLSELTPQRRRELRQYYANLELPFGADLDEVKHAYRRLMRQYHPDKHQADDARRQLATQLSQKLTVAYNELSIVLRQSAMHQGSGET